jgi:hypothetical protein
MKELIIQPKPQASTNAYEIGRMSVTVMDKNIACVEGRLYSVGNTIYKDFMGRED